MSLIKSMVSSKSNEWSNPQWFFNELNKEFMFTLDPCATDRNTKCKKYYTIENDGLVKNWVDEIVFMNPPYGGNTSKWILKAWEESKKGATVVCLIVSSTDRSYWHEYIFPYSAQIRWIRGRLKFNNTKSTAPFASAVVIFTIKQVFKNKYIWYDQSVSKMRNKYLSMEG